ncbi:MAG: PaaI family thioesterase [Litoreibacter sp.]|nr:PaaI family thioesterase [Litoreibacter sp.]
MPEQFFAESRDDLPGKDAVLSMSGLEFMEGILNGTLPGPPIAQLLNYRLQEVSQGHILFRGTPKFEHFNPVGTVHGGWYGTVLDSAMACAVMTTVPKGSVYTTLEYKVNIVRAIPEGMSVDIQGEVSHAGRSTGVANGWIRGTEDGRVYATGSTTCLIMKID